MRHTDGETKSPNGDVVNSINEGSISVQLTGGAEMLHATPVFAVPTTEAGKETPIHSRISEALHHISAPFLEVSAQFTGLTPKSIETEICQRTHNQHKKMVNHIALLPKISDRADTAKLLPYGTCYQQSFAQPSQEDDSNHDTIFTSGPQEWNEHWTLLELSHKEKWNEVLTLLNKTIQLQTKTTPNSPWNKIPGSQFKPVLMQIYKYITAHFLHDNDVSFNNKKRKQLKSFITRSTAELKRLPIYDLNPLFQWLQDSGLNLDLSAKICVRILFSMSYLAHEAHVAHYFSESSQTLPLLQATYLGSDNDTPRKILAGALQWTLGYEDKKTSKVASSLRKIVSNDLQPRKGDAKRIQVISTEAATLANVTVARILQHPDELQPQAFNEITSSLRTLLIKTLSDILMLPSPQHDETKTGQLSNGLDALNDALFIWKKSSGKGNKDKNQKLSLILSVLSDFIKDNIDSVDKQNNLRLLSQEVKKLHLLTEALTPRFSSQYAGNQFIHEKFIPALLGNQKIQLFSSEVENTTSLRDEIILQIQQNILNADHENGFHQFMTLSNPATISWIFNHETDGTRERPFTQTVTLLSRNLIAKEIVAKLKPSGVTSRPTMDFVVKTIKFFLKYTNDTHFSPQKKQTKVRSQVIWKMLGGVQETFIDEIPKYCFLANWDQENLFSELSNDILNELEPLVFPAICEKLARLTCANHQQINDHSLIESFTDKELVQLLLHTLKRSSEKQQQIKEAMLRCIDMRGTHQSGKSLVHNLNFLINLQSLQSATAFKRVALEGQPPNSLLEILLINHAEGARELLTEDFFDQFKRKIGESFTRLLYIFLETSTIPYDSEEEAFCTNLISRTEKHPQVITSEKITDICTTHLAKKLFEFQQNEVLPLYTHFDQYCLQHPGFHQIIKGTHNFISAIRDGIDKYENKAVSQPRDEEKKSSDSVTIDNTKERVRDQVTHATIEFLRLVSKELGIAAEEEGTVPPSPWRLPFLYAQYHDQEHTGTVQDLVCKFLERLPTDYSKFKIQPSRDEEEQVLIRAAIKLNKMHAASKAITNRNDGRNPQEATFHPASAAIFKKVLSSKRSSSPTSPTSLTSDLPQEAFLLSQALIVLLHQQMGNLNPQITSLIFAVASSEYCPGPQPAKYCIRERDVIRISQAYLTETKNSPRHTKKQGFFSVIMAPPPPRPSSRLNNGSKSPSL